MGSKNRVRINHVRWHEGQDDERGAIKLSVRGTFVVIPHEDVTRAADALIDALERYEQDKA